MRSPLRPNHLKALLLACKHKSSLTQIHSLLITTGLTATSNYLACLVASYARIGDIIFARYVFDKLPNRGVAAWNSMIIAYSRRNYPSEVLSLYHEMINGGTRPDSSIFTFALKACSSLGDLEVGEVIWRQAVDLGYKGDVFVGSAVLNLYAKSQKMDEAKAVFDDMVKRDVVCWTTMITGFVQCGQALKALEMYRWMRKEGIEGDMVVMISLIQACVSLGDSKLSLSVHGYMVRRQMPMDDVVAQTSLIDMYGKNGHLELAAHIFKKMPHKNVISWGALISGFAQNGFAGNVLELLVEMQSLGYRPDLVSLVGALMACSQVGYLKMGKSIHGYVVRRLGFELISGTALINMYAKCGSLSCARSLFHQVESKDLILWNAMIDGYGIHGYGKEASLLFIKMRETNLEPDHTTFTSLLSALSHSGLVEEGPYWFDVMLKEYKIQPSEKHYACMVDLLSRAGQVEMAYRLINSMKTKPGLAIWVALLSGCHNYQQIVIGDIAAKKILELQLDDLGIYSLVSNFFSMARRWDEVAVLRKIMKRSGTRKVPGYSSVEVNGKHIAFLMEDKNLKSEGIVQILDSLDHEMRVLKYVSDTEIFVTR